MTLERIQCHEIASRQTRALVMKKNILHGLPVDLFLYSLNVFNLLVAVRIRRTKMRLSKINPFSVAPSMTRLPSNSSKLNSSSSQKSGESLSFPNTS